MRSLLIIFSSLLFIGNGLRAQTTYCQIDYHGHDPIGLSFNETSIEPSAKKYFRSTEFVEGENNLKVNLEDETLQFKIALEKSTSSFFSLQKEEGEYFLYNFSKKEKIFSGSNAVKNELKNEQIVVQERLDDKKNRFQSTTEIKESTKKTLDKEEVLTSNNIRLSETPDSISRFKFNVSEPIPKRAALFSALMPGLGQVYNKQYWKLGLVGAGVGVATGFIIFNNNKYTTYRNAYISRIDNDTSTTDPFGYYTTEDLNTLQSQYRTFLEYTVVASIVGYGLNIVDAFVSGHLRTFDVSPSLSVKPQPMFIGNQLTLGVSIKKDL